MAAAKLKRDKKGRFLPLGNAPTGNHALVKKGNKADEYEYHEAVEVPRPASPTLKKVLIIGGSIIAAVVVVYKVAQMLDIQQNIQVKMAGLRNAKMVGITGFGFTLDVDLINTTKSSMSMSYPIVTIVAKKGTKETQITQSAQKGGKQVTIMPNATTSLNFDFVLNFLSMLSVVTMINPFTLFSNIFAEIQTPTGKGGKTDFKKILGGTGLSFWAKTQIYAAGILKTDMEEQIF